MNAWLVNGSIAIVLVLVAAVTYAVVEQVGWRITAALALFIILHVIHVALEDRA